MALYLEGVSGASLGQNPDPSGLLTEYAAKIPATSDLYGDLSAAVDPLGVELARRGWKPNISKFDRGVLSVRVKRRGFEPFPRQKAETDIQAALSSVSVRAARLKTWAVTVAQLVAFEATAGVTAGKVAVKKGKQLVDAGVKKAECLTGSTSLYHKLTAPECLAIPKWVVIGVPVALVGGLALYVAGALGPFLRLLPARK